MPQERSDARKLERELKIKFEWREADKNLEKEERNRPLDLATAPVDALLQMESRSWRTGDVSAERQATTPSTPYRGNGGGFRSRNTGGGHAGGGRPGGRSSGSGRPGTSKSGPARRGR